MKPRTMKRLAAAVAAGNLAAVSSPAVGQTVTFLDLTAGVGYATNPFLRTDGSEGSGYGRLSAFGSHRWLGERGSTALTGFVENSTYFTDHGSKQIFSLAADTTQRASETVNLYASASFSGDLGGQLSNRFVSVPAAPDIPDPTAPPPVTVEDPELFDFGRRSYRLAGQAGASIRTSEHSTVTISGGAHRAWFSSGDGDFASDFVDDYTTLFGSVGYDRVLSERTAVGVRVNVSRTDYDGSDDNTVFINPELTARTTLSENWSATGAIGVTLARVDSGGDDNSSTNLSFRGSLCRSGETERFCGNVSRHAQNSAVADLVTTTSVGFDWFKRLSEDQTLQLSASASRYSTKDVFGDDFNTHHLRAAGNYDHRISNRLFAGVSAGLRSLSRDGPDPDMDVTGSGYLRYRFGDVQ
jgi:hypothetical protein